MRLVLRHAFTAIVAALAIMLVSAAAQAQSRVALVIGNGSYRSVPALANPANDANDMATTLDRLGFEVRRTTHASYDEMRRALLDFARKARGAEIALVFYAGHGIEVGGENWLIPIDAELKTDIDVDHEAIALRSILPTVESASKLGLVILDACRNNPFAAKMQRTVRTRSVSRGLAGVEPTGNVLVAYAAKDGTTAADGAGRNSPFTTSLLKHLESPGLEINFLFRNVRDDVIKATRRQQQPFVYGSLSSEAIYLKAAVPSVPPPPPGPTPDEVTWAFLKDTNDDAALKRFSQEFPKSPLRAQAEARIAALALEAQKAKAAAPPPPPAGPSSEELTWSLVKDSKDPGQLRKFVDQFPDSPHRSEAAQRMAALIVEAEKAKTPPEPRIDRRETARSLQLELKRLGCFDGAINGEFGPSTRAALRNFAKLAAVSVPDGEPSLDALKAVRGFDKRICPLSCPAGERAEGERCMRIVCPAGQILKDGSCVARVTAPEPRSAPSAPRGGNSKCFTFQGRQFCE